MQAAWRAVILTASLDSEVSAFMTNEVNKGWDGTYKGKRVNQDVYVYPVEYSLRQNEQLQQKGTVTLVR